MRSILLTWLSGVLIFVSTSPSLAQDRRPPPLVTPGDRYYDSSFALLIGIDRYRDRRIPPLQYAANDARNMQTVLTELGFKVVALLNEEATKSNIEAEFRKLGRSTPRDRLVVFFAGHGESVRLPKGTEEGFLVPHDAELSQLIQTGISMRDIDRLGERLPPKHIFFILDACHSGFAFIGFRDIEPEIRGDAYYAAATAKPAVQVFTAGETGQKAIERGGQGLFTRWLIQGLRGAADRDGDGVITANELAAFVEPSVTRDSGGVQKPVFGRLLGEGQFLFELRGQSAGAKQDSARAGVATSAEAQRRLEDVRVGETRQRLQEERERLEVERRRLDEERRNAASRSSPSSPVTPRVAAAAPPEASGLKNPIKSVGNGQQLFRRNCSVCHGPSGYGDGPAALALLPKPTDWRLPNVQDQSDGELFSWISDGGGTMPPWKHLPEKDRWELVNYIRSLR